jgi:hypothetical protein
VDPAREHSSLAKWTLWDRPSFFPFDDRNFVWYLDHLNLEYLGLSQITLKMVDKLVELWQQLRLATSLSNIANLRMKKPYRSWLTSPGRTRPEGSYSVKGDPFDFLERFTSFDNALGGNSTYLEQLDLRFSLFCAGSFQALVVALPENRGLTHSPWNRELHRG